MSKLSNIVEPLLWDSSIKVHLLYKIFFPDKMHTHKELLSIKSVKGHLF